MSTLAVIAKECLPGRVKTRLHPPLSLEEAAAVASASLTMTLEAARAVPADRHVLYLQGRPPAAAAGFEVIHQVQGDLDVRIAALFDRMTDRTLLIGMDTPQIDPQVLATALDDDAHDAWFAPATDGGFWALGMDRPGGEAVRGVRMSRSDTGAQQRARLVTAGLTVQDLPVLTDVDDIDSALEVAGLLPGSAFAEALLDRTAAA